MSEDFDTVMAKIKSELDYAAEKWGTDFDKLNTLNDWVTYICMYATDAAKIGLEVGASRRMLYKAAGLCISALMQDEWKPRHYDK